MKKKLLLAALLFTGCSGLLMYGWNPFKASSWESVGKTIYKGAIKPAGEGIAKAATTVGEGIKTAAEATWNEALKPAGEWLAEQGMKGGKEVLKIGGVNLDDLIGAINRLQNAIPQITGNIDNIMAAINSPNGPMKKGESIANNLKGFVEQAKGIAGGSVIDTVAKATGLIAQLPGVVNTLTTEINTMNTGVILDHVGAAVRGASNAIREVVNIRSSISGAITPIADILMTQGFVNALGGLANNLNVLADNIAAIRKDTGSLDLAKLINDLLVKSLTNMGGTVSFVKDDVLHHINDTIKPTIALFQPSINEILAQINAITAIVPTIQDRIERQLAKPKHVALCIGTVGIGCAGVAIDELGSIIGDMKGHIRNVFHQASALLGYAAKMLDAGYAILYALQSKIGVHIIPPKSDNPEDRYTSINNFGELGKTLGKMSADLNKIRQEI